MKKLAGPRGFEPLTFGLEARRYILAKPRAHFAFHTTRVRNRPLRIKAFCMKANPGIVKNLKIFKWKRNCNIHSVNTRYSPDLSEYCKYALSRKLLGPPWRL